MLFSAWCGEKQIQTPLETMKIGQPDQNLRRFYAEARTKKREDGISSFDRKPVILMSLL